MVTRKGVVVFDMDGVLVDVTGSYRASIAATVEHFSARRITNDLIQEYKNAGGWNNDWALSQKILADFGHDVPYNIVVDYFQQVFFGTNGTPGLIEREQWIVSNDWLQRLQQDYATAIFTGRLRDEAAVTLTRFVPNYTFDMIVADDDVPRSKPAPDGLQMIAARFAGVPVIYVGDTVDDAASAKAAGVRFIGIAHPENPKHAELVEKLRALGATHVLDNVNQVEAVL